MILLGKQGIRLVSLVLVCSQPQCSLCSLGESNLHSMVHAHLIVFSIVVTTKITDYMSGSRLSVGITRRQVVSMRPRSEKRETSRTSGEGATVTIVYV